MIHNRTSRQSRPLHSRRTARTRAAQGERIGHRGRIRSLCRAYLTVKGRRGRSASQQSCCSQHHALSRMPLPCRPRDGTTRSPSSRHSVMHTSLTIDPKQMCCRYCRFQDNPVSMSPAGTRSFPNSKSPHCPPSTCSSLLDRQSGPLDIRRNRQGRIRLRHSCLPPADRPYWQRP